MIERISLHIGRILGSSREKGLYYMLTENKYLKYIKTNKLLTEGDFIFYAITKLYNATEVLFYKRFDDIKIIEVPNRYWDYDSSMIPKDTELCIIKYPSGGYHQFFHDSCCYHSTHHTITINNNYYTISNQITVEETALILFYSELNKSKYNISLSSFRKPLSIEIFKEKEKSIKEQVEALNIEDIIESYNIKHESRYITNVGKDDDCDEWLASECNYSDSYILKILPEYYEHIWEDRGYPASYLPTEQLSTYISKAKQIESEFKQRAKESYDRNKHIMTLLNEYLNHLVYKATNLEKISNYIRLETRVLTVWGNIEETDIRGISSISLPQITRGYKEDKVKEYCENFNMGKGTNNRF